MTGNEAEFRTPARDRRRCLTVLSQGRATTGCLLLVSESFETSRVFLQDRNLGDRAAEAAFRVNPLSANSLEGEAMCEEPEIAAAA